MTQETPLLDVLRIFTTRPERQTAPDTTTRPPDASSMAASRALQDEPAALTARSAP